MKDAVLILGLNAYHGDSAACLIKDGEIVAAAEEERFCRLKHWAGYPRLAVEYCLQEAGCTIRDIDHIAVNRNPRANIMRKAIHAMWRQPSMSMIKDRLLNAAKIGSISQVVADHFALQPGELRARIHHVEHHVAHLASSFYVSPFSDAALVSTDGFGDFVGAMWGSGHGSTIQVAERVFFPHSLGLFYLALTQFLGFKNYGDEYKVMGLASYGQPTYLEQMRRIVRLKADGQFELGLEYFSHSTSGIAMTWRNGYPEIGQAYTPAMEELLGQARKPGEPLKKRHEDMAASLQAMYEEAFFHLLNHVHGATGNDRLCLAGGTAMNSVANGKIFDRTPFKDVYIQSAAGDAGGSLGAAYYVWNGLLKQPRGFVMESSYWGPKFSDEQIGEVLNQKADALRQAGSVWTKIDDEESLCALTAQKIAEGNVVGWFQGRMEWGPRALGNRSIVVDPRRPEMKETLNRRIKRREPFRPFAPSILEEYTGTFFEKDYPDPFMLKVYPVRVEQRSVIPAVTHVDGTGRLQTVNRSVNPRYWKLIDKFRELTGVPVILNTSFNENEPVVCTPGQAVDTFLRTKMDVLVVGNWLVTKPDGAE